jgi:hypothetical protein
MMSREGIERALVQGRELLQRAKAKLLKQNMLKIPQDTLPPKPQPPVGATCA